MGNLSQLRERINGSGSGAVSGIGHTRWATHGRVTEANCHPHDDDSGRVHVVMNGIVENWADLKVALEAEGAHFSSETDTEVVAHLIARDYDGDIVETVRRAYGELRGHYAFVVLHADEPDVLVGRAQGVPAGGGRRGGRELHRLGHPRVPGPTPAACSWSRTTRSWS